MFSRRPQPITSVIAAAILTVSCGTVTDPNVNPTVTTPPPKPVPAAAPPTTQLDTPSFTTKTVPYPPTTKPTQTTPPTQPVTTLPLREPNATLTPGLTLDEHFGYEPVGGNPWATSRLINVLDFWGPTTLLQAVAVCANPDINLQELHEYTQKLNTEGPTRELASTYGFGFSRLWPIYTTLRSADVDYQSFLTNCSHLELPATPTPLFWEPNNPVHPIRDRFWRSQEIAEPRQKLEACLEDQPGMGAARFFTLSTEGMSPGFYRETPGLLRADVTSMLSIFTELSEEPLFSELSKNQSHLFHAVEEWTEQGRWGWGEETWSPRLMVPAGFGYTEPTTRAEAHSAATRVDQYLASVYWDCYNPLHHDFVAAERLWAENNLTQEDINTTEPWFTYNQNITDLTQPVAADTVFVTTTTTLSPFAVSPTEVTVTPGLTIDEHLGYEAVGGNLWPKHGRAFISGFRELGVMIPAAAACTHPDLDVTQLNDFRQQLATTGVTRELVAEYGFGFSMLWPYHQLLVNTDLENQVLQNCPDMTELADTPLESPPEVATATSIRARFWDSYEGVEATRELASCLAEHPAYNNFSFQTVFLGGVVGADTANKHEANKELGPFLLATFVWSHRPDATETERQEANTIFVNVITGERVFEIEDPTNQTEAYEAAQQIDRQIALAYYDCYQPHHTAIVAAEREWTYQNVTPEDLAEAIEYERYMQYMEDTFSQLTSTD